MMRSIVFAAAIAAFGALGASASPLKDTYSSFWVFGDSLSDNGNLFAGTGGTVPASPPYSNGRFSDGPVWNEAILQDYTSAGQGAANFAFGGATAVTNGDAIPDLSLQIGLFGASTTPVARGGRPLASLWFGANDILDKINAAASENDTIAAAVAAANAVGAGVKALANLGITDFAVWNLPDIGAAPRFSLFQPGSAATATKAADAFNAQLDIVLAQLRDDAVQVIEVDTFGLFADVLKTPGAYGFTDTTTPCVIPGLSACTSTSGLLYFDPIHPTTAAHGVLSQTFAAAVPLPASGVLLAFGLGLLVLRRRAA